MAHEDEGVLRSDIEFLRSVETEAFSLVLSDEKIDDSTVDEEKIADSIKKIVEITEDYGTGLLITDQFIEGDILQIGPEEVNDINGEFDYVIINLNKTILHKRDDASVEFILDILSNIKIGGVVFVPETTYNYLPNKRKGIEALMKTLNLRIEVPPHGIDAGVIASRESF